MDRHTVTVSDGTRLSMIVAGDGPPLLMIPGWSQTADGFAPQVEALSIDRRVIAVDMRGHGASDKPETGYRVQRLAKDLHDVIAALGLERPDALGHSMGCSVLWSHISLFAGEQDLGRLVLVDQAPACLARPGWDAQTTADAGSLLPTMDDLAGFVAGVLASETAAATAEVIRGMFTGGMDEAALQGIAAGNVLMPRRHAAELLYDHAVLDWRPLIPHIRNRALVVGAEASIFTAQSQRWLARTMPDARAVIFPADEGGSHFMFLENPARFNAEVRAFLDA